MFNLNTYLNELVVTKDDEEYIKANDIIELTNVICDDPWLARQDHFGSAGAMERQLEYLGGTLLPNAQSRAARMASKGITLIVGLELLMKMIHTLMMRYHSINNLMTNKHS